MRISEGTFEKGHDRGVDWSIKGSAEGMESDEKEAMSFGMVVFGEPSREWCAGFGSVTGALGGFGFSGFDLKEDEGKCLFL